MEQNNEPSKVVFEDQEFQYSVQSFQIPTPKIIEWVIKYSGGLVKDEKQASYILIGFVAVAIILSVFLIFGKGTSDSPKDTKVLPAELSPLSP